MYHCSCEVSRDDVLIIGDINVYDENTISKTKFNHLLEKKFRCMD